MARTVAAVLIALLLWALLTGQLRVGAHHNEYLPGVPGTPAIQNLLADGERTWCTNSALANYPNAKAQLQQTYDAQETKLGNTDRFIAGTYESVTAAKNAGCEVWWFGRYDNFCTGCACSVHYASWPVTVNVSLSLGYFDYKSCFGHEEGHIHGLHEQYVDSGSIGCTGRKDTVMDCGSGVWELQPRDVNLICNLYGVAGDRFHACAPPPPTVYPYIEGNTWYICDPALPDAQCLWNRYVLGDQWYDKYGNPEWDQKVDIYYPNGGYAGYQQWNRRLVERFFVGQTVWSDKGAGWQCITFCFGAP